MHELRFRRLPETRRLRSGSFRVNDQIVAVNGIPVTDFESLILAVNIYPAGEAVRLKIHRDDETLERTIVLAKLRRSEWRRGHRDQSAQAVARAARRVHVDLVPAGLRCNFPEPALPASWSWRFEEGSPAAAAGLKRGQLIYQVAPIKGSARPVNSPRRWLPGGPGHPRYRPGTGHCQMKIDELREAFLEFFESKGCVRRRSDVLVPNDPTVLFTPAGMNQFKREFLGLGDPYFTRAATCQKCIRTGDIENVGRTAFHETFFEMLGNFSFGDYFKREAIHWGWEFLQKNLKIPADRLTISVYLDDDEAFDIWHDEIKIPESRITRMGEDDNFWPAGAPRTAPTASAVLARRSSITAPARRKSRSGTSSSPSSIASAPASSSPCPRRTSIPAWAWSGPRPACRASRRCSRPTSSGRSSPRSRSTLGVKYESAHPDGVRIRRMSDHVRALTFCIHENVRPGPEKQGYVIRRLLRRAVLDAYQMGRREPFLHQIVPVVADVMSRPYPELRESASRVATTIKQEEEQFLRNLENGLRILNDTFQKTRAAGSETISGKDAFTLHATYGIPVEVVESLAADHNLRIDRPGFEAEQKTHSAVSRGTTEAAAVFSTGPLDTLKREYHHGNEFLGYSGTEADARVIGIIEQNRLAESARAGEGSGLVLILDKTPFYGEAGGQVGDTGTIKGAGFSFEVQDTKKENEFILHVGRVVEGAVSLDAPVHAAVDADRRQAIRRAHTATHLLHHALHGILGKHAQQAGSKVEPDRLRFDFANPEAVGRERLQAIEKSVNLKVLEAAPVTWSTMPIAKAKTLGAMALFGEKYPDIVRVVQMGDYSRELCGGTHLDNVGQVGLFKIDRRRVGGRRHAANHRAGRQGRARPCA